MPQGAVYRRNQVRQATFKGERVLFEAIQPVLEARGKALFRDLRKANLRKRLAKYDGELYKKGDPTGKNIWQEWYAYFDKTLTGALDTGAGYIWDANQRYMTSQQYPTFPYNSKDVMSNYLSVERNGTRITDIPKSTAKMTNDIITEWYKTDKGLPELISLLEPLFGAVRAELIATTEMGYIASRVARDQMAHYGIDKWIWDAFDDAVVCDECLDLNVQSNKKPFDLNDDMPPLHPRCRCGVYYVGVDVTLGKFTKGGPGSGRYPAGSGAHPRSGGGGGSKLDELKITSIQQAKKNVHGRYGYFIMSDGSLVDVNKSPYGTHEGVAEDNPEVFGDDPTDFQSMAKKGIYRINASDKDINVYVDKLNQNSLRVTQDFYSQGVLPQTASTITLEAGGDDYLSTTVSEFMSANNIGSRNMGDGREYFVKMKISNVDVTLP